MAPSMTPVTSRSTVSGAAPSKVVVTVITGRSTSGSSRTSTPKTAARPAMTIRLLKHHGEDRPAHEERGEPARRPAGVGPRRHALRSAAGARPPRRGSAGRPAPSPSKRKGAPARSICTPCGHHHGARARGRRRRAPRRCCAGRCAPAPAPPCRRVGPDVGAVGAPLDRQRIDRREGFAGEAHARSRTPCRRAAGPRHCRGSPAPAACGCRG